MADLDDDELLAELGVEVEAPQAGARTPREERLIAGFEDILRFHAAQGRAPQHGQDRDIFERLYAVRLDRLRRLPEALALLAPMDRHGLLVIPKVLDEADEALDEDALLAELGVGPAGEGAQGDVRTLAHVRSSTERRAAEEVADRTRCPDFDRFRQRFERVERDLAEGARAALPFARDFARDASIAEGSFFILGGQLAYVASVGEPFKAPNGASDARLRLIYANGTESNLLRRSLQRALYKDEAGRRITEPHAGPLFADEVEPQDIASGTIYVLRSQSAHPFVQAHRELIHKIGVTGGDVAARIRRAAMDATYLLADVEVVATYALHNVNRAKLEGIFHRLFGAARLDLTIHDRFGRPVRPMEWFLVPLAAIDDAVGRITDGSIERVRYDVQQARLVEVTAARGS